MHPTWVILAGLAHLALVGVGTQVPGAFRWREDLARLRASNRRLFWVYGAFILLSNVGFGALSLIYPAEISDGKGVAGGFALFLAIYWLARGGTQYLVFATPDWPLAGRHPLVKHGLGALFFVMSGVYLAAFAHGRMT